MTWPTIWQFLTMLTIVTFMTILTILTIIDNCWQLLPIFVNFYYFWQFRFFVIRRRKHLQACCVGSGSPTLLKEQLMSLFVHKHCFLPTHFFPVLSQIIGNHYSYLIENLAQIDSNIVNFISKSLLSSCLAGKAFGWHFKGILTKLLPSSLSGAKFVS